MFGDKSTFGSNAKWSKHAKKKGQQEKILFCTFKNGQLQII